MCWEAIIFMGIPILMMEKTGNLYYPLQNDFITSGVFSVLE
jgi:hypothetical protein